MRLQKVSVRRAINDATGAMALNDISNLEHLFIEWAYEGDRKINSSITYQHKECEVEIVNHCGKLPHDFILLYGARFNNQRLEVSMRDFHQFGNGLAQAYSYTSLNEVPVSEGWINWVVGYWERSGIKFKISNSDIYMESVENGQVALSYEGLCIDEEGFPMILDGHTDAVSHYLQYRYYQMEFNRFPGKRGYAQRVQMAKDRWHELAAQAYGEDEFPDKLETEVIIAMWNNMLPMPNPDRI